MSVTWSKADSFITCQFQTALVTALETARSKKIQRPVSERFLGLTEDPIFRLQISLANRQVAFIVSTYVRFHQFYLLWLILGFDLLSEVLYTVA